MIHTGPVLNVERKGPVLRLTLNRPEVRNAFNDELIEALILAFEGEASSARVVILSGAGKSFCAGGDLNWMKKAASQTSEENEADALRLARLFDLIAECPAYVICRVQGHVFGGGCGLAAASDLCLAEEGTLFCFSEAKLGLVPATISRHVLPKIGSGHARALFASALPFDAQWAERIGLVHQVLPQESLTERVEEVAGHLLTVGPLAVAESKKLAREAVLSAEDSAKLLSRVRAGDEAKEGMASFLEKRPASYVVKP